MFLHQKGKGILITFFGALDEGVFRLGHEVSTRLDSQDQEKFHMGPWTMDD
jgi:hypothetical protein